jgi:hypothetical protein
MFERTVDTYRSDGFWTVHKGVVAFFQDPLLALVFSDMLEHNHMAKYNKTEIEDNFFTVTYLTISSRLCITPNKVQSCVQTLVEEGIFASKRVGIPSRVYYQFQHDFFNDAMNEFYTSGKRTSPVISDSTSPAHCDRAFKDKDIKEKEEPLSNDKGADAPVVLVRRQKHVEPVEEPSLFPSAGVELVFNHWNDMGHPLQRHKADPSTKMFQESILAIQKALRKHTKETIMQAMTDYKKILLWDKSWLTLAGIGHKVPLFEFFKFTKRTEDAMLTSRVPLTIVSWFDECLKGYDHLEREFCKYENDPNPKVTERLIHTYQEKVSSRQLSATDVNCFIRATKFVLEYHSKHKEKINWNSCLREKTSISCFAIRLITAIIEDAQDVTIIEPTWLCSARTMNSRFPKYMVKHGLLSVGAPPKIVRRGYDPGYTKGEIE